MDQRSREEAARKEAAHLNGPQEEERAADYTRAIVVRNEGMAANAAALCSHTFSSPNRTVVFRNASVDDSAGSNPATPSDAGNPAAKSGDIVSRPWFGWLVSLAMIVTIGAVVWAGALFLVERKGPGSGELMRQLLVVSGAAAFALFVALKIKFRSV